VTEAQSPHNGFATGSARLQTRILVRYFAATGNKSVDLSDESLREGGSEATSDAAYGASRVWRRALPASLCRQPSEAMSHRATARLKEFALPALRRGYRPAVSMRGDMRLMEHDVRST
jgi:hypothetical protein